MLGFEGFSAKKQGGTHTCKQAGTANTCALPCCSRVASPSRVASYTGPQGVLLKGPDVGSSDPGPRGPKLKNLIFNLFWAPGDVPNRCALKFHANHSYFHNFWWHGMKILIFGCKCTLGYPGAPGDGGSVYMLALEHRPQFCLHWSGPNGPQRGTRSAPEGPLRG